MSACMIGALLLRWYSTRCGTHAVTLQHMHKIEGISGGGDADVLPEQRISLIHDKAT
jgi:hypothetical protein